LCGNQLRTGALRGTKCILVIIIDASKASAANQPAKDDTSSQASGNDSPVSIVPSIFLRRLAQDQKEIWTGTFKITIRDLEWLVPLAGLTAGSIKTDTDISSRISTTSLLGGHSNALANAGVTVLVAGADPYLVANSHSILGP
jgi:hypothetical protein